MDLSLFNDAQRQAITLPFRPSELSNILVVAGAGSGKTRVLVHRIAFLMENRVPPTAILGLTFTKKAADEMKERLVGMGIKGARQVFLSTFHSLAADILRKSLPYKFEIIDEADKRKILKQILKEVSPQYEIEGSFKVKDFDDWFSYLRNKCENPFKPQPDDNEVVSMCREIATRYTDYKKKIGTGVFDFDDLLEQTLKLLFENKRLREAKQRQWPFILVDEYQDTNKLQFRILSLLKGNRTQLLQVGDEDQLIYSWRGAEIEHIMSSYEKSQKDDSVQCVLLDTNYRCSANILSLANKVVGVNRQRTGKILHPHKEKGASVKVIEYNSCYDESKGVSERVSEWIRDGVEPEDIAILMRTNMMARGIERALIDNNIPYTLYNATALFESREVRLLMALIKLTESPSETFYLQQVLETIKMRIGDSSLRSMDKKREAAGLDWIEFFRNDEKLMERERVSEFVIFYDMAKPLMEKGSLCDVAKSWLDNWDLMQFYKKEERESKTERLLSFFGVLEDYEHDAEMRGVTPSFADFQEARLLNDSMVEKRNSGVQVMSIHKSKGLEFKKGVVLGVQDGVFPRRVDDPFGLEEEIRAAYVALTRFMEELIVTKAYMRVGFNDITTYSTILDDHLEELETEGKLEIESSW